MSRTLRSALNESNPNKLPDGMNSVNAGDALAAADAFQAGAVATNVMALPQGRKAAQIVRAFARVGGTTGYKVVVAPETAAPAATQVTVSPTGDILFAAADTVTDAEVFYKPAEGELFTETVQVTASVATLSQSRRATILLAATVVTGVIPGAKTVFARGTASAAGQAALSIVGSTVAFNAADVVGGTATLTYLATPGIGGVAAPLAGRLEAGVDF